tara:strand:- start:823 stop:1245 length:423 start_codon:yes stop_codon:yes gene_type:complete
MSINENFGLLHGLNFMYLTLSHQGDGEIHPKEIEKSSTFVFKYALESESIRSRGLAGIEDYARTAIQESCEVYESFLNRGRDKIFEFYGIIVGNTIDAFPPEYLNRIYNELYAIAEADGAVTGGEKVMLEKTAQAWGLST